MGPQYVGVFMAFGTQGDVLPLGVVAAALAKAAPNYTITFITHSSHERLRVLLEASGVHFCGISSPSVLPPAANNSDGRHESEMKHRSECLQAAEKAFESAYGRANFIAINFFALEGWHISEAYDAQCIVVAPYIVPYSAPSTFQRVFKASHPLLYDRLQRATPNEVCWNDVQHWMWPLFMERWTSWRVEVLHLSPVPLTDPVTGLPLHAWPRASPVFYGISRQIVECPGYWPSSVRACGFWFAPDNWEHVDFPQKLQNFIFQSRDPKPVLVGFSSAGSMGYLHNPEGMLRVLRDVFVTLDRRCILMTTGYPAMEAAISELAGKICESEGQSEMEEGITLFDGRIFCYSGYIPYSKLLNECSLVVHHGGSGTTAACLRAGIPQVICPFIHDQFYWAERMAWLGVAPKPLQSRFLIPDLGSELGECVNAVLALVHLASSPEMRSRSIQLGETLGFEDGCANAMKEFLRALPRSPHGPLSD